MKKKIVISLLACILTLKVFSLQTNVKTDGFLFWCDGYVAASVTDVQDINFTYFYESIPLVFSDITSIDFPESNLVEVENFNTYKMESDKKYKSFGIHLKIRFKTEGVEELNQIQFTYANGTIDYYNIGTWVFDIDGPDCSLIDTWESPALSGDSQTFFYSYKLLDTINSATLKYGKDSLSNITIFDNELAGNVILKSDAPMKYIKAKILLNYHGKPLISYAKGCYCGALDISEEDIKRSKQHFSILK